MSATRDRRSSISSSTATMGKRHSMENLSKVTPAQPQLAKKRQALSNLTNQKNFSQNSASKTLVPCTTKIAKVKKAYPPSINNAATSVTTLSVPFNARPPPVEILSRNTAPPALCNTAPPVLCSTMDVSPSNSDERSVSLDEITYTFDSLKSPQVEYIDNDDSLEVGSIEKKTSNSLCISEKMDFEGSICRRELLLLNMDTTDEFTDVDDNDDPQFCKNIVCDIYNHLRESETKKRPSTDFMEVVQQDINPSMRAILVDWLVEVSEEYRLVPETLFLTVNYIDRYLSGNVMDRQRLQLLGVACMMIASKYEEICAPQVEEFCYITDNTYFKEEVLQMESSVLNYLKFEMTAPTVKCFLRRFVRAAAQGNNEPSLLHLECMASYLAELSLIEYTMLCYAQSLIAASAIFLALYILTPSKKPWNSTLTRYTLYHPSDLRDCVEALRRLCYGNVNTNLPAIREKYSQHKYKFVAKKYCPPSIPSELFRD